MQFKSISRRCTILGGACAAVLAVLGAPVLAESADAPTVLQFSTMAQPSGPMANCFTLPLLNDLVARSDGRLSLETYMGGTGFANPLRQYEQVARGVMDISQGVLSYSPGQFALTEMATMPMLVDDAEDASRAINTLAGTYLADEFSDIYLMAILVTPPLYVHTRANITSLDDLEGLRIRSTGAGANAFLEALGAIPVQLPAPAVYENLQTGVIDGAISESVALRSFRIGEVATHHLLLNTTAALLFLGMNPDTLAALPPDIQDMIRTDFSGPEIGARASACWETLGQGVVDDLRAAGQTFTELSDADRARAREIAAGITDSYIDQLEAEGKPARAFHDALVAQIAAEAGNN